MARTIRPYCIHQIILVRGPEGVYGTGTDQYGEPLSTGATPETLTLNARVEWDNQRVRNEAGEEVDCSGMVFIPPTYLDGSGAEVTLVIGPRDRIIFEGREHAVVMRLRAEGWVGDTGRHWEVWIV